ncbi:MAG TPA: calcium-binding protein, partial [Solirubrobacteraceae bacterium]
MRRALVTAAAAAAALALPATAFGSTAGVSGGVLTYTGGPEANTVTIARSGAQFVISDTTATEAPGAGCAAGAGGTVVCPAAGVTRLESRTNGGADVVRIRAATPATLIGGTGDDVLSGGSGDDVVDGEGGADELGGGAAGKDTVTYAARTSAVTVDLDGNADDGSATDASGGVRDTVYDSIDVVVGGQGGDTLRGDDRATALRGGPGADTLDGGFGADDLVGGDGIDTVTYAQRTAGVTVDIDASADDGSLSDQSGARRDRVDATVEHVTGGAGGDTLVGSAAANTLKGGAGNDTLLGLGGPDTFAGGLGNDTVSYARSTARVIADIDGVRDDGSVGDANRTDLIGLDVENLTGGARGDDLTGGSADNVLDGGPGSDLLVGGGGTHDAVSYAARTSPVVAAIGQQGAGNASDNGPVANRRDVIDASIEDLIGGSGNDVLTGSGAANRLRGGAGDDQLTGQTGADQILGEAGTDTGAYSGHAVPITVTLDDVANDGATGEKDDVRTENVTGGDGDDVLSGNAGPNRLDGGGGKDLLRGNAGSDVFDGGSSTQDAVSYGTSQVNVTVKIDDAANDGPALEGDNVLTSVERVYGGQGNDWLEGGPAGNYLDGQAGNDHLDGQGGDDQLTGGAGADDIAGGSDRDIVFYVDHGTGVTVDLDDVADDGNAEDDDDTDQPTMRDNVGTDIESVVGSLLGDSLTAGPNGTQLNGFDGNDALTGGAGNDDLFGGPGSDALSGLGGEDQLDGGEDSDSVS